MSVQSPAASLEIPQDIVTPHGRALELAAAATQGLASVEPASGTVPARAYLHSDAARKSLNGEW